MKSIEQSFKDWEGGVFGFGYGTGEPHVIPALRQFFTLCNRSPNGQYDYAVLEAAMGPAVAWFVINAMGQSDVIEYGSSPRYGWLTDKGLALQRFMLERDEEKLVRLACALDVECYQNACNCDGGYVEGRKCVNPFWQDDVARAYLAGGPTPAASDVSKQP